jgi:hypothetical protein
MTNALTRQNNAAEIVERVVLAGDLSKLAPADRVRYYNETCKSIGLNPLTRPFEYINLNGKLTLYARKDATDQLRKLYNVSLTISSRERIEDVYIVTARATLPDGRVDESTGVVSVGNLKGDNLANALMKAETKAKRRVTLSICGLGWLDETEMQTIHDARPANVDMQTGEIVAAHIVEVPRPAKPEATVDQARDMFWQRFGPVLAHPEADPEWSMVRRLLDMPIDEPEPATVERWREIWRATDNALAAEAERAA